MLKLLKQHLPSQVVLSLYIKGKKSKHLLMGHILPSLFLKVTAESQH